MEKVLSAEQAEELAARTLLDKGIKVRVTAPLFLRVFGKQTVGLKITQPVLGTMYRISQMYLKTGIDEEFLQTVEQVDPHLLVNDIVKPLTRIMAYAILNGKWSGRLFASLLAKWLIWRVTAIQLLTVAKVMVALSSTTAFCDTIRLVAGMKMTSPNLSQDQGS